MSTSGLFRLPTELIDIICCYKDFKYQSYGNRYVNKDTRLEMIRNLRLTRHHLYRVTRGIWTDTYRNRFPDTHFSLDTRSLSVLLYMAKDSFLLSKIGEIYIHKARIFSYEVRLEYERSPELVHWLVAILSSF